MEQINSKIAGVSFRQEDVKTLKEGQELILKREPTNQYDSNAIQILTKEDVMIGFINRRLAEQIAPILDKGKSFKCTITKITGADYQNKGVNILLEILE